MDTLTALTKEELIALVKEQAQALQNALREIATLKKEIERLQSGGTGGKPPREVPDWVKPNSQATEAEPKARKKRAHGFTHHRLPPTKEVFHACDTCPDCHGSLRGGWERSRRQIIDLPPLTVQVTDHITVSRYCGRCGKNVTPAVDLTEEATGQQLFGHGVVSLVAYLKTVGRVPVEGICRLLSALTGLKVSTGQGTEMLDGVARSGKETYAGLKKALRAASYVHADETGWREAGQNGYVWSFSTPSVRYFEYHKSRAGSVPKAVLGEAYSGIIVSDFYRGYSYHLGLHQRCWVHFLRDLKELVPKDAPDGVKKWVARVTALYWEARNFTSDAPKERALARVGFQERLCAIAQPYVTACLPQSVLAKRVLNFESELFTFVEYPDVPSENNPAERSVRPVVIARKVSGGTRSSAGSQTMATLASLFGTWQVRGQEGLAACRQMLIDSQKPQPKPAA